jgi:hypothetical protein
MCAEILRRFPNAIAFGGNIDEILYFLFVRLKLSQALAAVGSPGAPGEFDHQRAVQNQFAERELPFAIGGSECKSWRRRACR